MSAFTLINVRGCHLFGTSGPDCEVKSGNTLTDVLIILLFILDMFGLFCVIPFGIINTAVTYYLYDEMRNNIYLHLEGNR